MSLLARQGARGALFIAATVFLVYSTVFIQPLSDISGPHVSSKEDYHILSMDLFRPTTLRGRKDRGQNDQPVS